MTPMADNLINALTLDDFHEGLSDTIRVTVSSSDIDAFAALTGDTSPLHMDVEFANSRGFEKRVAHGALICGYTSRLFGVHFPGKNCIVHSLRANFISPVYEGDEIDIRAEVKQVSEAAGVVVLSISATHIASNEVKMRGQAQIGFTGN
jgi:3-hydroxybutyryl-CoA dehydratase